MSRTDRVRLLKDHWVDTPEDPEDLGFWVEAGDVVDMYDGPDDEGSIWFEVDGEVGISSEGGWEPA